MSAVGGLQRPAMESLVPRLVDKDELPAAAALALIRGSVGMIAGPAIGGVLIASAGLTATYLADVLSYAASGLCLWLIRAVPPPEGAERPSLAAVREGFWYARSRQELIGTDVVDFVAMVFGMPLALFPAGVGRLGSIYVRSDRRGRGYGSGVTSAVTSPLLNLGLATIALNVREASGAARTPASSPRDATTGKQLGRRRTIPPCGEPGDETWGGVAFARDWTCPRTG